MGRKIFASLILAGTALAAAPALAQDDAALAAEIAAMRAKIESLEAKVKELEGAQQKTAAAVPSWKGAPHFENKKAGWSFKPLGRLQYDVGYVESPNGVRDPGLGFSSELRRARLGVEGTIPGGFGYKLELGFDDNEVEVTDAYLSYEASDQVGFTIGQHNNFQSLEEVTSSRFLSFMERAAFTDAFNFERRVGLSARFAQGDVVVNAGVFTDNIADLANAQDAIGLGDENDAVSFDGRIVYAPKFGGTQLHLGGSAHYRDNGDTAARGPATRYRQRPFIHTTNTRFLATPGLRVATETNYGLEAALIRGPFHATGELHWLTGDRLAAGVNPTFFGGYAEAGYFLTGETRGYKAGRWDRTKVLQPVGEGGLGALQVNLRYDHLDLTSGGIIGGRQQGYLASLIWIPQDHVRFYLNYGHLRYDDAAVAAAGGARDYGIDVFGARAQVDF
ncbi:MAG: porin [Pseudomonadota bacterium]|nr:porin [Pseudomonadota bacterium]